MASEDLVKMIKIIIKFLYKIQVNEKIYKEN